MVCGLRFVYCNVIFRTTIRGIKLQLPSMPVQVLRPVPTRVTGNRPTGIGQFPSGD